MEYEAIPTLLIVLPPKKEIICGLYTNRINTVRVNIEKQIV